MKKIQIAVIGLGYWGPNIIRNLQQVPNAEITMICDLSKKQLEKISLFHPHIPTTQNANEIFSNKHIHAVCIATPVETHFSLAKQALLAKKHIFIEKPFTKTSKEAEELISVAKKKKKLIMVDHTFVYSNAVTMIKKLIEKKHLGKLLYYDSRRINLGIIQKHANVLWDLASHDISILQYLISKKPVSVQAVGSKHVTTPHEEMAHLFISYHNNFTAHIHVSWLSPVKIRSIMIGGSKKMILYNDIEPSEKLKIYDKTISIPYSKVTPFTPAYREGNVIIPHIDQTESLLHALTHFIQCIQNKKEPLTNGIEGLHTVKILEAADLSLRTKKQIML